MFAAEMKKMRRMIMIFKELFAQTVLQRELFMY